MTETTDQAKQPTELDLLKQRADVLGVKYSANIGVATLKERIEEAVTKKNNINPTAQDAPKASGSMVQQRVDRNKARADANALVRVRITNHNPKKTQLRGEVFTIRNKVIGTISKMIPYTPEYYENGYHVPRALVDHLKERTFTQRRKTTDQRTRRERVITSTVHEFTVEELPPLTEKQLKDLAQRQQAARSISDE